MSKKVERECLHVGMDVEKEVQDVVENMEKKPRKKKKSGSSVSTGMTDCNSTMPNLVDDGFQLNKTEKIKKKNKRKAEVCYGTCNNKMLVENGGEEDGNYQIGKVKKMKKRRLEHVCDDKAEDGRNGEDDLLLTPAGILKDKDREGFNALKEHKKESYVDEENGDEQMKKKKKKKKVRREDEDCVLRGKDKSIDEEVVGKTMNLDSPSAPVEYDVSRKGNPSKMESGREKTEKIKKTKKVQRNKEDGLINRKGKSTSEEVVGNRTISDDVSQKLKKKSKKKKSEDREMKEGGKNSEKETSAGEGGSKNSKPKKRPKRVSFSGEDEVFPISDDDPNKALVHGKRFTPEEDEMVKEAVFNYIKANDLGEDGLNMVLHCKSHPRVKNCWADIGAALPHRPYSAIYNRAHILFERDDSHSWNDEELELLRKYYKKHGPKWRQLADAMGKHRRHLKDTWRRIKLPNRKSGQWSQEEYQTLFDLVNIDLRAKVSEEKKSKHGMLRDNISWTAISDKLSTRTFAVCCMKWYDQLTSPMVKEGKWADVDDYHLLDALYALDACCAEDVDWDSLLEHRSGDACRKRWSQMANHIGEHGKKSFADQVEILSKRYCRDVLEAREAWDNKPVVP